MKKIQDIIKTLLISILEFVVLLIGVMYVYNYVDSMEVHYTSTDIGPGGEWFLLLILELALIILWYILIIIALIISIKIKNVIYIKAQRISLTLPIIGFIFLYIWYSYGRSIYYQYERQNSFEEQKNLVSCIISGETEEAIDIIQSENIRKNFVIDNQHILLIAQKDKIVFDTLFKRIKYLGLTEALHNNDYMSCQFCYFENEEFALNAIEKMNLYKNDRGKFPNYNSNSTRLPAICNNEDLLLFFIKKNWHKCVERFLVKVKENRMSRRYNYNKFNKIIIPVESYKNIFYNCQILEKDTAYDYNNKPSLYNGRIVIHNRLRTVNPYDYTNDSNMIKILDKFSFIQEEKNIKEYKLIQSGDLIFRKNKLINYSPNNIAYNDIGVVIRKVTVGKDKSYLNKNNYIVYSQSSKRYKVVVLENWIKESDNNHYIVKRIKNHPEILYTSSSKLKPELDKLLMKNYDYKSSWSDNEMYNSEFVWKAFKRTYNIEIGIPTVNKDTVVYIDSIYNSNMLMTITKK